MKKLIQEVDTAEELERLLGKRVTFFCLNYIYVGKLIGLNERYILLENPAIVYETGPFSESDYKDEQSLCVDEFYLRFDCVESFGILK